jgi:serine protease inhibitor
MLATLNGYDKSAVPPTCPKGMKLDGSMCKGRPQTDGGCLYPMALEGEQCIGPATLAPSAKLSSANALMPTKLGELVSPGYAALLKAKYGAEVFKNAGLADVNAWVERKTKGKIDKILDELDDNSAAVLLNAVYFKAVWETGFVKFATYDGAFWLTPSQQADVPTMHQYGRFAVVSHAGFGAIRLPYVVPSVGLIVVLPEKIDGVGEIGKRLAKGELPQLLAEFQSVRHKKVDLSLPRFKASFKADLVPLYKTPE